MAKHLNSYGVQINIEANNKKALSQVKELQKSLTKLQGISLLREGAGQIFGKDTINELKNAEEAAQKLSAALGKSLDFDLGKINFSELNKNLEKSGTSISQTMEHLSKGGSDGKKAFVQLARQVASVEPPMKKVNNVFTELWTTMKNTARWQLTSGLLHGFVSELRKAVSYVKDLDKSLNKIRIVTGFSKDDMKEFAEEANAAAKALRTTTLRYADAALIYFQQGDSAEMVRQKTETTIKAANVAGTSAREMSEHLTGIWNSYKVGSEELELFVDKLAAIGAETASSLEEIAGAMTKVAATAYAVGVSFDQLSSIIATVSSVTRTSEESIGTAFKTIFARMGDLKINGVDEDGIGLGLVSGQLKMMGIDILDITGQLRDMGEVVTEIGDKWQIWNKNQQVAIAQAIAGKRQYTQLIALFENWERYQKTLGISEGAEGTLEKQSRIFQESWEGATARVRTSMEEIYSNTIDDEAIIKMVNGLALFIEKISDAIEAFGGLGNMIVAIGGLMITKFSSPISQGIDKLRHNFLLNTGKLSQEYNDILSKINLPSHSGGLSKDDKVEMIGLQKKIELSQKLLEVQKKYGPAVAEQVKNYVIGSIDSEINKYKELRIEIDKVREAEIKSTKNESLYVKHYVEDHKEGKEEEELKSLPEKGKVKYSAISNLVNSMLEPALKVDEAVNKIGETFKNMPEKFSKKDFEKKAKDITTIFKKTFGENNPFENLYKLSNQDRNDFKKSARSTYSALMKETMPGLDSKTFSKDMTAIFKNGPANFFSDLAKNSKGNAADIEIMTQKLRIFIEVARQMPDKLFNLNPDNPESDFNSIAVDNLVKDKLKIFNLQKEFAETEKGITGIDTSKPLVDTTQQEKVIKYAGAIASLSSIMGTAAGVFRTLGDESKTFGDKIAASLPAVVGVIMQVIMAIKMLELTMKTGGGVIIAIVALIAVLSMVNEHIKKQKENRIEANKKIIEEAKATKELSDANKELYNSYNEIMYALDGTTDSKKDAWEKTVELCDQYNIEISTLDRLTKNYNNYAEAIKKARAEELNKTNVSSKQGLAAAERNIFENSKGENITTFGVKSRKVQNYYAEILKDMSGDDRRFNQLFEEDFFDGSFPLTPPGSDWIRFDSLDISKMEAPELLEFKKQLEKQINDMAEGETAAELRKNKYYNSLLKGLEKTSGILEESGYEEALEDALQSFSDNFGVNIDPSKYQDISEYKNLFEDFSEQIKEINPYLKDEEINDYFTSFANGVPELEKVSFEYNKIIDISKASGKTFEQVQQWFNELSEEAKLTLGNIPISGRKSLDELNYEISQGLAEAKNQIANSKLSVIVSLELENFEKEFTDSQIQKIKDSQILTEAIEKEYKSLENFQKLSIGTQKNFLLQTLINSKEDSVGSAFDMIKNLENEEEKLDELIKQYMEEEEEKNKFIKPRSFGDERDLLKKSPKDLVIQKDLLKNKRNEAIAQLQISTEIDWAQIDLSNSKNENLNKLSEILKNGGIISASTARYYQDLWPEIFENAKINPDGSISLDGEIGLNFITKQQGDLESSRKKQIEELTGDLEELETQEALYNEELEKGNLIEERRTEIETELKLIRDIKVEKLTQLAELEISYTNKIISGLESEVERYHEINFAIQQQEKFLSKLSLIKSKVHSGQSVRLLEQEIKAQEKMLNLQKKLAEQAKFYAQRDRDNLSKLGVTFSKSGAISNYESIVLAAKQKMDNAASDDKKAKEDYDALMDRISKYEESYSKILDAEMAMLNAQFALDSAKIKKMVLGINLEFELKEDSIQQLDFIISSFDETFENAGKKFEAIFNKASVALESWGNLTQITAAANQLMEELKNNPSNGLEAITELEILRDKIISETTNLIQLDKEVRESYGNALSQGLGEINDVASSFEKANSVINQFKSLRKFLNDSKKSELFTSLNEAEVSNTINSVQTLKATYDMLVSREREFTDELMGSEAHEALKRNIEETYSTLVSTTEAAMSNLKKIYEEQIDEIVGKIRLSFNSAYDTIEELRAQHERFSKEQERYLTEVNKLYGVTKLENSIEKTIGETSNKIAKERLQNLLTEVEILKDKENLTEYELKYAEALFDVESKRIAMEEAQNTKSKVRLVRDASGNMAYQYTADKAKIDKAKNDYEKAINDIYNLSIDRVNALDNAFLENREATVAALEDIARNHVGTQEELEAKLLEASLYFAEQEQYIVEQSSIAKTNLKNDTNSAVMEMSDEFATSMQREGAQYNSIIDAMMKDTSLFKFDLNNFVKDAQIYWKEYETNMEIVSQTSAISLENMKNKTEELDNKNSELIAKITGEDGLIEAMDGILDKIEDSTASWLANSANIQTNIDKYQTLTGEINKAIAAMLELDRISGSGISNGDDNDKNLLPLKETSFNYLGDLDKTISYGFDFVKDKNLSQITDLFWESGAFDAMGKDALSNYLVNLSRNQLKDLINSISVAHQTGSNNFTINFPNVGDHKEIEEAIKNLVNDAASWY